MKTKKGYTLRSLGNESLLVPEALGCAVDFSRMISMNATAAFLWQELEGKEFDTEAMVGLLLDNYDITRDMARHDAEVLLQSWQKAGVIED